MRQLGSRPPESPPVETDVATPSEILPHERFAAEPSAPVEVHRVERNPMESESAAQPRETMAADPGADTVPLPDERLALEEREPVQVYRLERNPMKREERADRPKKRVAAGPHPGRPAEGLNPFPAPVPFPEPNAAGRAPIGRWEEFHEFRNAEPKRGRRLHLEPVPVRQGFSSKLLTADLEREHRSSFLSVVLVIAALLAIGALVWGGFLRYRVNRQEAAMSALQEQNQKLAESLAQVNGKQMSAEQKDSSALNSSADLPQSPAAATPPASSSDGNSAVAQPEKRQSNNRQPKNREGVATPPAAQQPGAAALRKGSEHKGRPADSGYAPEIVPPYPTNFKSENVAVNAANSQPVPNAGAYHPPFTPGAASTPGANQQSVPSAGSDHFTTTAPTSTATAATRPAVQPAPAPSRSPGVSPPAKASAPAAAPESTTQYQAIGNGAYASPLAQNIEAVEELQRHSPVQLKEFHARAGGSTAATRNVQLSVQNPDPGRGSYTLVVAEQGSSHQLRGQVNHPLVFTDTATGRTYALVVLSIADQQVYGYVRATE
jgi:Tfp pilus assembly protein PilE